MKLKRGEFAEVENIVFDFGNVLVDVDHKKIFFAFEQLGIVVDKTAVQANEGLIADLETGRIGVGEFCNALRDMSSRDGLTDEEILNGWNSSLKEYDYRRFELLNQLKQSGYKIFLLSNINRPHRELLERRFEDGNPFGRSFKSFFDKVYYSDELGMRKPNEDIYKYAQQDGELEPQRTLFIDDLAVNLVVPSRLGWHTHNLVAPETVLDLVE